MIDSRPVTSEFISLPKLLVITPAPLADTITSQLQKRFQLTSVSTLPQALQFLAVKTPAAVYCSSAFSPNKLLRFFSAIKDHSQTNLIPLLIGIDFNHPIATFPATRWAGKLGLVTADMSSAEYTALLDRLLAKHSTSLDIN
jgi:hypothetical protein